MDEDAATRKRGRPSERPSGIHAATTLPPGKKQHVRIADLFFGIYPDTCNPSNPKN